MSNAFGEAEEKPIGDVMKMAPQGAKPKLAEVLEMGFDSVRVVDNIEDAISCDLVTEAGAGGKVINIKEQGA